MAKNRTLLPGIAVSLLLHAGLIALWSAPKRPAPQPEGRRMMVWLTPASPPASPAGLAPMPAPVPSPPDTALTRPRQIRPPVHPERPAGLARQPDPDTPPAVAVPASMTAALPAPASAPAAAQAALPADPFAAAPAPAPGKFDVNAAMKSARKLATAKSTKDDPAVAQIYDKPLYGPPSDTPLGKSVANTARADCKNVAAGTGLLALVILPVMILTDKKDSGCKW